jgi:hypothetical protein
MKKFIIDLNAIALPLATVATVISCGSPKTKEAKVVKKEANFDELKTAVTNNKAKIVEALNKLTVTQLNNKDNIKTVLKDVISDTEKLSFVDIINELSASAFTVSSNAGTAGTLKLTFGTKGVITISLVPTIKKEEANFDGLKTAVTNNKAKIVEALNKLTVTQLNNKDNIKTVLTSIISDTEKLSFVNIINELSASAFTEGTLKLTFGAKGVITISKVTPTKNKQILMNLKLKWQNQHLFKKYQTL